MKHSKNQQVFFELVRAGLWGKEFRISQYKDINYSSVMRLAEEQSVVGLIAAGLERLTDIRAPKECLFQFIGQALHLEHRNKAMNAFVAKLIETLRKEEVYALLVKGQGIAQCYKRPLWRACGDVDLLLDSEEYEKAKRLLVPLATAVEQEYTHFKHIGMTIESWVVELHGTLHSRLSKRIDKQLDAIQEDTIRFGNVRSWRCGDTDVILPCANNDVVFVFTHILHHFFFEGIGLRQICDWCRLLWTYREEIDVKGLGFRLDAMGVMSEWKAFAAFAVKWLGMPEEAMPLYSADACWERKADRICSFVLEVGNFGHNKMINSGRSMAHSYFVRKFFSFWGRLRDMLRHFKIFPLDSIRFFWGVLRSGVYAAVRGE